MPKYTFICQKCSKSSQQYTSAEKATIPCKECGGEATRQLPTLSGATQVNETVDHLTGATWKKDQEEQLQERKDEYYWTVEVPRFVQTYSLETCLEQGWCYVDDHGKVQLNTKPPHKR